MSENTFHILRALVAEVQGPKAWSFRIADEDGALWLVITIEGHNNYAPKQPFIVSHFHPVPITTYNKKTWRRWIFEQCRRTMNHELGETVRWGEDRPFAPLHGPGEDPYTVHEFRDEVDARTIQDGSIRPPIGRI